MEKRNQFLKLVLAAIAVLLVSAFVCGLISGKDLIYYLKNRGNLGPLSRSDIQYVNVDAPVSSSHDGTVKAVDWETTFPNIVMSMGNNKNNSYVISYLEQDPYLVNIYEE